MPHIFASLQGYPGRWVNSLENGPNLTVTELLEHMDCAFGDMCEYDTMIWLLYEIRQKEGVCGVVHVTNPRGCGSYLPHLPGLGH